MKTAQNGLSVNNGLQISLKNKKFLHLTIDAGMISYSLSPFI